MWTNTKWYWKKKEVIERQITNIINELKKAISERSSRIEPRKY